VIALTRGAPVGVDVEGPVPPERAAKVARRFFGGEEARLVDPSAFLRAWAAREAVAKALGLPLHRILASTRVEPDPAKPLTLLAAPPGAPPPHEWTLHELALTAGRETVVVAVPRPGAYVTTASAYCAARPRSAAPSARSR
jgi:phosphopantetheinyl transferase